MTVAVAGNFPEGVVLGVDSALTISDLTKKQVVKVYENAEKLFQLGTKPIGIAAFGTAIIGGRTIGSYIQEFEAKNPENVVDDQKFSLKDVVEQLRIFFMDIYKSIIIPEMETLKGKKFDQFAATEKPSLGLAVGGFSGTEPFSEVWEIAIPSHNVPNSATQWCHPKEFRCVWFALNEPIIRYTWGYDRRLIKELNDYITKLRGTPLNKTEGSEIEGIMKKFEYQIPCGAMPIQEGIAYVRFQVELVINHHRFALGAPIVGGDARIGIVTYKDKKFQIIEEV